MAAFVIGLLSLLAVRVLVRRHRRHRLPARAVIVSPRRSTVVARDGAVHSVQSAELTLTAADLERLWNPKNLENLARTYWRFLSRVTLGLIRVRYGENDRSVIFIARPLTLLRFDTPQYTMEEDHGSVRWQILDGLLVARPGRGKGYLTLDVSRNIAADSGERAKIRIEVAVTNFYPSIAAGFSTPAYSMTQSVIHVLVTHGFLRSLATLDLAASKVGKLAVPASGVADGLVTEETPEPAKATPGSD